jgi:hypothetical protein
MGYRGRHLCRRCVLPVQGLEKEPSAAFGALSLRSVDPGLTRVETVREAATLVTLAAIGWVAAETWRRRIAAFFVAFTVWDLTYYLFLTVLDGWPASVMDRDVFFLIPVPWVGPVLTALVLSTLVLGWASWAYLRVPAAGTTPP